MELLFAAMLIVGGIQCFFGYRIFRFLTALMGLVVGAAIGAVVGYLAVGQVGAIAFGLILGVLGALLAFKLYKLGVFIICFAAGAVLGGALGLMAGDQTIMIALAAVAGLALGVLGVILTKPLIIISTSLGGGMCAGMALGMLMDNPGVGVALGVVLAVAGILFQFYLDKKKAPAGGTDGTAPEGAEKGTGFKLPSMPKAGEGGSVGEGLKGAFASLKTSAAGLGQKVSSGAQNAVNSQAVRQFRGAIDNTRTTHPLPGWNELVREDNPLWVKDLPVVVNEARIVAQAAGDRVCLALGFQNLTGQDILGVFFSVKCYDLLKQELEGIAKLAVQDFRLASGGLWFSEQPFPLPDKDTRRVELTVKNVVFADGTIWANETEEALAPLTAQPALELPQELAAELFRECRAHVSGYEPEKIFRFQPQREADHWCCACGQLNQGEACIVCGMGKETLFDLARPERLSEIRDARLAEQKRLEEERRQKIAEQTEAAKQKAAEVSAKTAEALKKGLGKGAELGKQTGDTLNKGLNKGAEWGKQTGDKLKAFWAEKIEPNKRSIAIVACVFVAVLAVLLGTLFGLRAYRAAQEQRAQAQAEQEAEEHRRQQEQEEAERRRQEEEERRKAEEERKAAMELAEWESQFFFPYSDKEAVDENALAGMSEADLELAKYEILARHGRVFSTPAYAQYFESQPWYVPDAGFSENDANALSEMEQANMALIDRVLTGRKTARVAQAMLNKLEEEPITLYGDNDPYGIWENIQPQDGTYFWVGRSYNADLRTESLVFYWMIDGRALSSSDNAGGILTAKRLDMNKDGVPELLILRTASDGDWNDGLAIRLEVWESSSAGELRLLPMDDIDLSPVPATDMPVEYTLSFVPGVERDHLCVQIGGWTKFYSAGLKNPAIEFFYSDGIGYFGDPDTDPVFEIDGRAVSETEYRQTLAQWSQGAVLWGANFGPQLPSVFYDETHPLPEVGCSVIDLDMKAELEATREYLTGLANG